MDAEMTKLHIYTKVVFSFTTFLAITGNTLLLLLFLRFPSWLKKTHNQCIFSLAVTDVLTAISLVIIPRFLQDVYSVPSGYIAREIYCRIIWSHFIPFSLGITSVYTCLVLAIERWFAVIKPLQYKLKFSVRRMRILIFCCWLSGFLIETPIIPRISGFESKNGSSPGCEWTFEINKVKSWTLAIALFAGQTFVPCCLISAAYLHILLRFRAKASASPCYDVRKKMLKRATLMMAVASLVLILCWMPNQIYFLLGQLGYIDFKQSVPSTIVVALAFFNCWMNPIIYGFMNVEFRRGYRQLLVLCLRTS